MRSAGARSWCETVETKVDFISSTIRSEETFRKAKMRPETDPTGSCITASVSESQTSSPPRWIESRRSPAVLSLSDASSRWSTSTGVRPRAASAGTPVIVSAELVPQDDLALAVDGDDPVGDVGEDRVAPLSLERDPLVELGVGQHGRGVPGQRGERLDLLLTPDARPLRVDGEHALEPLLDPDERHAQVGGVTRGEDRVVGDEPRVTLDVGVDDRRARLDDVARGPSGGGRARAGDRRSSHASDRADDELVALDQLDRARVGAEQRRSLVGDLLEDRGGLELRRQEAAQARELLGERARGSLAFVELAALEAGACSTGQPTAELEIVVGERPLLGEEDDDEPSFLAPWRVDGNREQRPDAREPTPLRAEPVVVVERRRGQEAPLARGGPVSTEADSGISSRSVAASSSGRP